MTKPTKVLLIEDDMGERTQVSLTLAIELDPIEVREVDGAEAFSRALESSRYDLAIVERRLTWSSGLHVGSLPR